MDILEKILFIYLMTFLIAFMVAMLISLLSKIAHYTTGIAEENNESGKGIADRVRSSLKRWYETQRKVNDYVNGTLTANQELFNFYHGK